MSLEPVQPRRALLWPPLVEELAGAAPDAAALYMVGGMVRDALAGRPIHDIDLATPGDGLRVARALADALGGAYYPVDPERRTGRVILEADGGTVIDVASFRGNGLLADLQGRDFTINAMAVRLDEPQALYDPLDGQADLFDRRVVRQCTPGSIASDPIRALRAVRQSIQFGLRIERETLAAARAAVPALQAAEGLAQPERARDEFVRMLAGEHPTSALRVLQALGLLAPLSPYPLPDSRRLDKRLSLVQHLDSLFTIISPRRTDNTASQVRLGVAVMVLDRYRSQLQEHLSREIVAGRPVSVLGLLAAFSPADAEEPGAAWASQLRLAVAEARAISGVAAAQKIIPRQPPVEGRAAHRYYREVGEAGVTGVLLMLAHALNEGIRPRRWGDLLDHVASPLLEAFFRRHQEIVTPPPLLDGRDLMQAFDLQPGPLVGQILVRLLEEQAAGVVRTRAEALRLAERLIADAS